MYHHLQVKIHLQVTINLQPPIRRERDNFRTTNRSLRPRVVVPDLALGHGSGNAILHVAKRLRKMWNDAVRIDKSWGGWGGRWYKG